MFLTDGRLNPTTGWEIEKDGRYELTYTPYRMPAGSARTVRVPRTRIFHAVSGLVSLASLAADTTFLRRIEKSFSQEASGFGRAYCPQSPLTAEKMLKARGQLSALKGKTTFLESMGQITKAIEGSNAPAEDWSQRNFGPKLSEENAAVYESISRYVLSACGIPPELAGFDSAGTGRREAYRQFSHSTVQPLSRCLVEAMADLGRTV